MSNDGLGSNPQAGGFSLSAISVAVTGLGEPITGGNAALGWRANTLANGGSVTITTDGTFDFGTKAQAAQRQLAYGSDVRVNGTPDATEVLGGAPSVTAWSSVNETVEIVDDVLPDSVIDQMYLAKSVGSIIGAAGFEDISPADGITLYTSMWVRDSCNFFRTYVSTYDNVVGTFNTNADYNRGERVTITKDGEIDIHGYVTRDDPTGFITFEVDGAVWAAGAAGFESCVITGDVSGAVCTAKTTAQGHQASALSATKILRIYQEGNITQGTQSTSVVTSRISNGLVDVDYFESGAALDVPPYDSPSSDNSNLTSPSTIPETWIHYELELDFSGASGRVTIKQNGTTIHERTDYEVDKLSPNFGFRLDNIGMDTPGLYMDHSTVGASVRFGKLYADSDLLRVYIADASTLATSTEYTPLPITAWSSTSITADNYGDISGKYLIVSDGFNEIGSVLV